MREISKFHNFLPESTYHTSKESIFHVEFNFIQKKYDFLQEKLKKNNFFNFLSKSRLTNYLRPRISENCRNKCQI